MKKNKATLSKKAEKIIAAFDEAARDWGWSQDQATKENAAVSEKEYEKAFTEIKKYILSLEKRLKRRAKDEH